MPPTERSRIAFRPSMASTLALGALALAFAMLGSWQWDRAAAKQALQEQFASPNTRDGLPAEPVALNRVRIHGHYQPEKQFLVDNRVLAGQAGVHVLTPFATDTGTLLLVNRGWLPWPDRSILPVVPQAPVQAMLQGHLDLVRQPGLTVGGPEQLLGDRWPQVVTYPDMDLLQGALGEPLYPMVLYLEPGSPGALAGLDWNPFPMPAARHRGYAVTWFALLLSCLVAWLVLGVQRSRRVPG